MLKKILFAPSLLALFLSACGQTPTSKVQETLPSDLPPPGPAEAALCLPLAIQLAKMAMYCNGNTCNFPSNLAPKSRYVGGELLADDYHRVTYFLVYRIMSNIDPGMTGNEPRKLYEVRMHTDPKTGTCYMRDMRDIGWFNTSLSKEP